MSNELYRDFIDRELTTIDNHIVDIINGGGIHPGSGHNYSTTEQVIGTWIDGSILYEKTIIEFFPTSSQTVVTGTVAHGISNLNIIVSQSINNFIRTGEAIGTNSSTPYYAQINSIDSTNITYKTNVHREGDDRYMIFVLRYTKTNT